MTESVQKDRKLDAAYLLAMLEEYLPRVSDDEFTMLLNVVETHRIRRLSMKIAVPWSYPKDDKQG